MLPENPALALANWRAIREKIVQELDTATTESQREALLQLFKALMDMVDSLVQKNQPEFLSEFRNARRQDYKLFITRECLVGENISAIKLLEVTRREIASGRMTPDCEPTIGRRSETLDTSSNAEPPSREYARGLMTVLLYPIDNDPEHVGVSKVDPPVRNGAFFLDFTRPLETTRRIFGKRNRWVGQLSELVVPVVHQGEKQGEFKIYLHCTEPRFSQIRKLWKQHYPAKTQRPVNERANGFKVIVDFAAQFPEDC